MGRPDDHSDEQKQEGEFSHHLRSPASGLRSGEQVPHPFAECVADLEIGFGMGEFVVPVSGTRGVSHGLRFGVGSPLTRSLSIKPDYMFVLIFAPEETVSLFQNKTVPAHTRKCN